tara:strand:+ start:475 stop:843 length:369 start_codon:yes stop_codon:yes gene_type:complete
MADIRVVGQIQYNRGTGMNKWEYDYMNQKTGGRAVHLVRDCPITQELLIKSPTEIECLNATIMVKNLSPTGYVAIGDAADANSEIRVMPYRFALWTSGKSTADLDIIAVGNVVKVEIIVVEA